MDITMEFIEEHPEKPWDWSGISVNPNITMEIIEKHPVRCIVRKKTIHNSMCLFIV